MPGAIHKAGRVGVVSRSGTLTYEAVGQLTGLGIGQSTCVGIGGDPVSGTSFVDVLAMFEEDPDTDAVVLIGEIGGLREQEAAEFIASDFSKPVAALIVGPQRPSGQAHGSRRRDHHREGRARLREDRRPRASRSSHSPHPSRHRRHSQRGTRERLAPASPLGLNSRSLSNSRQGPSHRGYLFHLTGILGSEPRRPSTAQDFR